MQFTVIIVNYQVKHFLEQCLCSIQNAANGFEVEIKVIDNNSSDGSREYIPARFPGIEYTWLNENPGFGKANNKALETAKGRIIVFLNPDTIVPENFFFKCQEFFQSNLEAGAIGVRMIDGSGNYLPESKRAFPSPLASLFKLTGISLLFPRSPVFARYYLGHLDPGQIHEVEVLAGACMLVRKEVLEKTGAFDPVFFMYGEDIDLSYRIHKAGWKNFYLPEPAIIHFKGESTRKGSLNYVMIFYHAMVLFVKKHFQGAGGIFFRLLLQFAIGLRAALSLARRFLRNLGLPFLDAVLAMLSLGFVMWFWYGFIKTEVPAPANVVRPAFPVFAAILIIAGYFSGLYDSWFKPFKSFSALLIGVIVVLAGYSLLPENLRFSRGIILFGGLLATAMILLSRFVLFGKSLKEQQRLKQNAAWIIAGNPGEYRETIQLLGRWQPAARVIGRIGQGEGENGIGRLEDLHKLKEEIPFDVLIFSIGNSISASEVIQKIRQFPEVIRYRFHFKGTGSMVGSDDNSQAGEVLNSISAYQLGQPEFRRSKRVFDVIAGCILLLGGIFLLPFSAPLRKLWTHSIPVIFNRKTWVSLSEYSPETTGLPGLKPGVLNTLGHFTGEHLTIAKEIQSGFDDNYARNYHWGRDLEILWKSLH